MFGIHPPSYHLSAYYEIFGNAPVAFPRIMEYLKALSNFKDFKDFKDYADFKDLNILTVLNISKIVNILSKFYMSWRYSRIAREFPYEVPYWRRNYRYPPSVIA